AERGLADAAGSANDAMQGIARLNRQLAGMSPSSAGAAALMDQRDAYVDQLSQLMDIRVVDNGQSGVSVFTNSGVELVGVQAAQIQFTPQGTMTPDALWSSDPAKRSVGTLTLVSPNGGSLDLLASNSIRSGSIAALVDMRDNVLPAAQAQLDGFAAAMAQALSNTTTAGTPAASGAQNGFDLDLSGLASGNVPARCR
ncbi:MAG: flagellar hook-associated protein FlgK, partial [Rhizobiales bacterium]|nr:flagellar hook-associated protein FlgK [Hyphomicrobiales bacterium]